MYTDETGRIWYKVGLHIHTNLSDGKLSPKEVCKRYKNAGFDAIAITDHWAYHDGGEIEGLKIISGCEYNLGGGDTVSGVMHIVGLDMKKDPCLSPDMSRQEVIDGINSAGGMAVLAHPCWSLNSLEDVKALKGISMVEIYNSVSNAHQSMRPYSGYLVDVMANSGIIYPLIATDDAHYYDGTDDAISYIMVNAEEDTTEAIVKAIREEKFFASQGPMLFIERKGDTITLKCSGCETIFFSSNMAWTPNRITRGENLTEAVYQIQKEDKWVRVEITDKNGNQAWSNIIKV